MWQWRDGRAQPSSAVQVKEAWRPWMYDKRCPGGGEPFGPAFCEPGQQLGGYATRCGNKR